MDLGRVRSEAMLAEFIGTFTLTFAILAALQGVIPLLLAPFAAALTLGAFVLIVGSVSGAHLNPAVTLGMFTLRKIDFANAVAYVIAQLSGALLAMVVLSLFNNGEIFKLDTVGADMRTMWAEFLGALIFTFGVASTLFNKLKGIEAASVIGISLLIGLLFASLGSNGLINPAVAVGVGSFSWSYAIGPLLGGIVGMNLYLLLLPPKKRQ